MRAVTCRRALIGAIQHMVFFGATTVAPVMIFAAMAFVPAMAANAHALQSPLAVRRISYSRSCSFQNIELGAKYPQFSGGSLPAMRKVNSAIRSLAMKELQVFEIDMVAAKPPDWPCSRKCEYELSFVTPEFVSLSYNISTKSGEAQPEVYCRTFNCAVQPFKKLTLPSLLGADSVRVYRRLSNLCRIKLSKSFGSAGLNEQILDSTEPVAANFASFTFNKQGIKVVFNDLPLALHCEGPQTVEISYNELQALISSYSPIYQLAQSQAGLEGSEAQPEEPLVVARSSFENGRHARK